MDTKPILVTGAHRSGTTWVGKMLAASREVAYISEPLNVWHRPGVMRIPTKHWYTYISEENEKDFQNAFQEMLEFQYHGSLEIRSIRSLRNVIRMMLDWGEFFKGNTFSLVPLIKDPFALFSAEWFAKTLNCQVVIVVRHPAAVVSSLMRLGWNFDFHDLLVQPQLMKDWLDPYRDEMEKMLKSPEDVLAQGSLLWRMVYHTTALLQDSHPEFIVIRHEDVSKDPIEEFRKLYSKLGISFSNPVRKKVANSTSTRNPEEISLRNIHAVQLNSQANIKNWQKRLSAEEIDRIYQLTGDVAPLYYSEADWQ